MDCDYINYNPHTNQPFTQKYNMFSNLTEAGIDHYYPIISAAGIKRLSSFYRLILNDSVYFRRGPSSECPCLIKWLFSHPFNAY